MGRLDEFNEIKRTLQKVTRNEFDLYWLIQKFIFFLD